MNEHERELKKKYGTTDKAKIFKMIDKKAARGPFRLGEIGIHETDIAVLAKSHIEDAVEHGHKPGDIVY